MIYKISIPIEGYITYEVKAKDKAEAIELALIGEAREVETRADSFDSDINNFIVEVIK